MKQIDKYLVRTDVAYDPETLFWVDANGSKAVIGMSPLVQETSGNFVALQLKDVGEKFVKGEAIGTIEAEKHVGPVKAPVSGKVLAVNNRVIENPGKLNADPYNEGWIMEIELSAPTEVHDLVSGENNIIEWFEMELVKFTDKGWIAQP